LSRLSVILLVPLLEDVSTVSASKGPPSLRKTLQSGRSLLSRHGHGAGLQCETRRLDIGKRFERYKESLFSFIESDGVPWHNNAAERSTPSLGSPTEDLRLVQREKVRATISVSLPFAPKLWPFPAKIVFSAFPTIEIQETSTNTETGAECIRTGLLTPGRRNDAPAEVRLRRLARKVAEFNTS